MDKNFIVKKSNYFIMNSSYDLSLEEQKIILTLASMVQPDDEEFKPYNFKISDFMTLIGVEDKSKYTEIPKITKELMKKVFEIEEDDTITQIAWLSSARYKKGSGMVILEFSPRLKPYMIKLNGLFTQYKLSNILSMKSKYSPRIYELLKCNEYKKQGYIDTDISDLRQLLKAENIYPRYYDFRRFVLEATQKELKNLTDITFDFEEIRQGRKVISIRFYIKSNKKLDDPKSKKIKKVKNELAMDKETPLDTIENDIKSIMSITKNEFSEKTIMLFMSLSNGNIDIIKKRYEYMNTRNIQENRAGYMRTLLENWEEPKASSSNEGFNNFEPRKYDYDSLEKKLLGWD